MNDSPSTAGPGVNGPAERGSASPSGSSSGTRRVGHRRVSVPAGPPAAVPPANRGAINALNPAGTAAVGAVDAESKVTPGSGLARPQDSAPATETAAKPEATSAYTPDLEPDTHTSPDPTPDTHPTPDPQPGLSAAAAEPSPEAARPGSSATVEHDAAAHDAAAHDAAAHADTAEAGSSEAGSAEQVSVQQEPSDRTLESTHAQAAASRRSLRAEHSPERAAISRRQVRPQAARPQPVRTESVRNEASKPAPQSRAKADQRPASASPGAGGRARKAGQALLLLIVAAIVIGLGTVVAHDSAQDQAGPSGSELARLAALDRATLLSDAAQRLSAGAGAAMKPPLADAGSALRAEIAALTIPGTGSPSTSSAASASGSPTAQPAPPATVAAFVAALGQSSTSALVAAQTADGPMARLLAAVGAGQLAHARSLAKTAGLPVPPSPALEPTAGAPDPTATGAATGSSPGSPAASDASTTAAAMPPTAPSSCSSPHAAAPGVSRDRALVSAVSAEQEAIYAYQVSATRLFDPASSSAVAVLATHEDRLAQLRDLLRGQCLQLPAIEPGYTLASAFTQHPAEALAGLEDQLGLVYGDLIALSTGAVRSAAIAALVQTTDHAGLWGTSRALPGLDVAGPPAPTETSTPSASSRAAATLGGVDP